MTKTGVRGTDRPPAVGAVAAGAGGALVGAERDVFELFASHAGGLGASFHDPAPIVPAGDRSTLFVSAAVQLYRQDLLGGRFAGRSEARLQWCIRLTALSEVGQGQKLTAFRMLSLVEHNRESRADQLRKWVNFFARLGIDLPALEFVVSGGSGDQPDDEPTRSALTGLGVPGSAIHLVARRWAAPFGERGPCGPNLSIRIAAPGHPPFHLWNLEFLDFERSEGGGYARAEVPILDSAGSIEGCLAASFGSLDCYAQGALELGLEAVARNAGDRVDAVEARWLADHFRTVALLALEGIVPSARGHGAVMRRLARRCLDRLMSVGLPACEVVALQAEVADRLGLAIGVKAHLLEAEAKRFSDLVQRSWQGFSAQLNGGDAPSAEALFRLRSEQGVPPHHMDRWIRDAGLQVAQDELRRLADRHSSWSRDERGPFVKRRL